MFKNFLSQPLYYGNQLMYNMFQTRDNYCSYNRVADSNVEANRYMVMFDFSDKNDKNSKLLIPFRKPTVSLTLTKQDGTTITLKNGFVRAHKILYDYFSTDMPLDLNSIKVESNCNLYVEWVVICPIDTVSPRKSSSTTSRRKVNNNLYPIFDTVTTGKVVTKYDANTVPKPQLNDQYQILNRGDKNPISKTVPWYEFTSYSYLDIVRYFIQFVFFLIVNIIKYPFTNYNQVIYDGLPISYGAVADKEILFGKNFMYAWQVGNMSVIPYNRTIPRYNKYLPLATETVDSSDSTYYICDLNVFKDIKVTNNTFYNNKLCWGTVILEYKDGYMRPVIIDFGDNIIHMSPSLQSSSLTTQHVKDVEDVEGLKDVEDVEGLKDVEDVKQKEVVISDQWLDAMRRLQDTHMFVSIYYHITLLHDFNEFLCVVFKRNFTPNHPLYHLYIPFTDTTIGGGVFDSVTIAPSFPSFTPDTYQQISNILYANYTIDDMQYDKYLVKYGFTAEHINQSPVTSRLLSFWKAVSTYVDQYIDTVYNEVNGNDITKDQTIANWFNELKIYKGLQCELDTVDINTVKTLFKIHVFQVFNHWSDHNQAHDMLSDPESSVGYNNGHKSNKLVKLFSNYIAYIANSNKYNGNISDFHYIMDLNKFAFLDNERLLSLHYNLLKSLLDVEHQELQHNNYREALLLNNVYQGTAY